MAIFLAALGSLASASPASAEVSDVPDRTAQANGPVFAVLPVGDKIYIGGDFTQVDGVPRSNLAAIDASTGNLSGWNPGANRRVAALAASPDKSRIYVGGSFTQVGGITRNRVAALDAATGVVDTRLNVSVNSTVRALAVTGYRLYLGGDFTTVGSQSRTRLAAIDRSNGTLDANWTPAADNAVRALAFSPDGSRLYAGGDFAAVSGQSRSRIAALNPVTGAVEPWKTAVNTNGTVFALAATGSRVYSAEGGPGGAGASYDALTGARRWRLSGDGDGQAITVLGSKAYIGGHFVNFSGQPRSFFAAADATTGALDLDWDPHGGRTLSTAYTTGVWSLVPDAVRARLYAGTNFSHVSGKSHSGFVQFSDSSVAPPPVDTVAPTVNGVSPPDGAQDVSPGANAEALFSEGMDPATLNATTFTLTREDGAPVAATIRYDGVTDKVTLDPSADLEAGRTYAARITTGAKDIAGNALAQDRAWSFTTASGGQPPEGCTITGTSSGDTLTGTSGPDHICGGGGNDTIRGLDGNDVLKGQGGSDQLYGGEGADTLDGGISTDYANFSPSAAAVTASLADGTAAGEGADVLLGIESLVGSPKDDTLSGSGGDNRLLGGQGNDAVTGSAGADRLLGGDGDDTVDSRDGVSGNDSLDGGLGTDTRTTDASERSIVGFP